MGTGTGAFRVVMRVGPGRPGDLWRVRHLWGGEVARERPVRRGGQTGPPPTRPQPGPNPGPKWKRPGVPCGTPGLLVGVLLPVARELPKCCYYLRTVAAAGARRAWRTKAM